MIQRILKMFKKEKKIVLGRWNTSNNILEQHRKIDLANCDSCGVCRNNIEDIIHFELLVSPNHATKSKK